MLHVKAFHGRPRTLMNVLATAAIILFIGTSALVAAQRDASAAVAAAPAAPAPAAPAPTPPTPPAPGKPTPPSPGTPAPPAPGTPTPPAPGAAATVAVTILGIHATNDAAGGVDPLLQPIAAELQRKGYKSFRVVASATKQVPLGSPWELPLVEGYVLRVRPEKATADGVELTLSWVQTAAKGAGGATDSRVLMPVKVTIRRGKYLLSGGWKLKSGELLAAVAVK